MAISENWHQICVNKHFVIHTCENVFTVATASNELRYDWVHQFFNGLLVQSREKARDEVGDRIWTSKTLKNTELPSSTHAVKNQYFAMLMNLKT
jgi:hypothetical protein